MAFYNKIRNIWRNSSFAHKQKKKRFNFVHKKLAKKVFEENARLSGPIKILDIGSSHGRDFLQFLANDPNYELHGMDLTDKRFEGTNFNLTIGDVEEIPFPDDHFDMIISMGTLEHIQPIEKLCRVIKEIDRAGKTFFIMVPAISTFWEPHVGEIYWQLRGHNKKTKYSNLNYFSDEAWLQFEGFNKAKVLRKYYIPLFKTDLWIYKTR